MIIKTTNSICPICLKKLPAVFERDEGEGEIWPCKTCPEHGSFKALVWKGFFDREEWTAGQPELKKEEIDHCAGNCHSCSCHLQDACCVILEVTKACDLHCPYCFAYGGDSGETPSMDELKKAIDFISINGKGPLLQLSGGEPTLRDDLPELVSYAKKAGCSYVQINTNGMRLAEDREYVKSLADAGLDIVFLQFDGTDDEIFRKLRGRDLLAVKERAIDSCAEFGLSVTLVPTVVRGVNEENIGEIVRFAVSRFPKVKAVHFQPVTYLGRYPKDEREKITLDELMHMLCSQTGIDEISLLPSRCDHALCEFHGTYIVGKEGKLIPSSNRRYFAKKKRSSASENREFVASHWTGGKEGVPDSPPDEISGMDLDSFLYYMKNGSMTISAMAFQDAMDMDLERLASCSLLVYEAGKLIPFCGKYLTPSFTELKYRDEMVKEIICEK